MSNLKCDYWGDVLCGSGACVSMDIRIANTWMAKEGRTAKEAGETTVGWLPLKDFIHPLRPRPPPFHPAPSGSPAAPIYKGE